MHCEYPLILEKPLPKPSSAILNESVQLNPKPASQESIVIQDKSKIPGDTQPSMKRKSPSKQPAEVKGKEKQSDQQIASLNGKSDPNQKKKHDINPVTTALRSGSNDKVQGKREPKPSDSLLLMGRHFLKKDVILSYKKKLYHCSATKERE